MQPRVKLQAGRQLELRQSQPSVKLHGRATAVVATTDWSSPGSLGACCNIGSSSRQRQLEHRLAAAFGCISTLVGISKCDAFQFQFGSAYPE